MFLSLERLFALKLANITRDGKLVIKCSTIRVVNATYQGKQQRIVDGSITIRLPNNMNCGPELLCEHDIGLTVEVDPHKSHNPEVKKMAGIAPSRSVAGGGALTIEEPTLVDGVLTATICVATIHASSLPAGSTVVAERGQCTIAIAFLPVSELKSEYNGYSYGSLNFNFHRDIASRVEALLHPVEETKIPPTSPLLTSPSPIILGLGTPTGSWADDADDDENASASTSTSTPVLAPVLPPSEVANALSGIKISLSKEQNAARKEQKRLAAEQKRLAEEQRLLDEEKEAEEAKVREEDFRKESIRIELKARQRQEEERKKKEAEQALVKEYDGLDPFTKTHLGITKEQFLADPEECRARIREFLNSAVPEQEKKGGPEEQEGGSVKDQGPSVLLKTPDPNVVDNIVAYGKEHGIHVLVTSRSDATWGTMHFMNVFGLIGLKLINFAPSRKGNELRGGVNQMDDKTFPPGYHAFLCSGSYAAIVSIRPDLADTVRQVMLKRVQMKHPSKGSSAGQGILPTPLPLPLPQYGPAYVPAYAPVYDNWSCFLGWQVVPGA